MEIKQIEEFWINGAFEAFDTAKILYRKKKYSESMFFLHLSIEKFLKGLYVNQMQTDAPFGHNLQNIAVKINSLNFHKEIIDLLSHITVFNISARYDDIKKNFYKICNKKYAKNYLIKGKELLAWLKSQLK